MRYLFSPGCGAVLHALVGHRPLLAFDFDGTLSPLIERPVHARLRSSTRKLLTVVAARAPVVVISGRAVDDLRPRFEGIAIAGFSGNHGLEPWGTTPDLEPRVQSWVTALRTQFGHLPGIDVQDKRWSVTVDYRHVPDLEETERRLAAFARTLTGVRVLGGRHADLNLAPVGPHHKGAALRRHMAQLGCHAALYVGDDRTDEDVFALPLKRLVGVRIGRRAGSHARYFLHEQPEIDRLLEALIAVLRAPSGSS
jgi:trehalose 6-phosphate phosphatase